MVGNNYIMQEFINFPPRKMKKGFYHILYRLKLSKLHDQHIYLVYLCLFLYYLAMIFHFAANREDINVLFCIFYIILILPSSGFLNLLPHIKTGICYLEVLNACFKCRKNMFPKMYKKKVYLPYIVLLVNFVNVVMIGGVHFIFK